MEVTKLVPNGIRIKTKLASFVIDPLQSKAKVAADGVLLLTRNIKSSELSLEEPIVVFNGPGEYEIKGIKFSGIGKGNTIAYVGRMEGVDILVSSLTNVIASKDLIQDSQFVMLHANVAEVDQNILTSFNANVMLLFGQYAPEIAKALGKEVTPVSRYTTTKDKLPAELEVVVLG